MIVGVDLDGVVRDFLGALKKKYKKVYPDHKIKEVNFWGLHEFFPIGRAIYDFIWEWYPEACLRDAEPLPGAKDFITALANHCYEICIVTAQPTWQAKKATFEWLVRNDILNMVHHVAIIEPNMGLEMGKSHIKVDILLEDAPHHLEAANMAGIITVCYDQPWNQDAVSDYRVKHYDEFLDILAKYSKY